MLVFLGASLKSGVKTVLDAVCFNERIKGADLVITGEGRLDSQTLHGKTVLGVAGAAKEQHIPVLVFAGSIADDITPLYDYGISAVTGICSGPVSVEEAMQNAKKLLTDAAKRSMKLIKLGSGLKNSLIF
jgi:glycerate kinase